MVRRAPRSGRRESDGEEAGMPDLNIYTSNWTLAPLMDAVEAARFTAKQRFAGIELECNPLEFWPSTLPQATIGELIAIGEAEGIGYTIHAPDINAATALPEARAHDDEIFRRLVDLAVRLSSPVVGVHPGVAETLFSLDWRGVPYATARFDRARLLDDARERAVETLARWGEQCAEAGLTLTVENEVHTRHTVAPTAAILASMVTAAGREKVKVNLDTGHAFIGGGLAEEFAVLADHIVHMHLDDGRKRGVSEHLPLGEGVADFSPLAGFMRSFGGAMVLEIFAPERPVEATLESRAFLMRVVAGGTPRAGPGAAGGASRA